MAPEALTSVEVGWHGLLGDRRWAFVRDGVPQSGFPWLTMRERATLYPLAVGCIVLGLYPMFIFDGMNKGLFELVAATKSSAATIAQMAGL